MRYRCLMLFGVLVVSRWALAEEVANPPAAEYQALVEEFEKEGGSRSYAPRFLAFAEQHTTERTAMDALIWVLKNRRTQPEATQALAMLERDHLQSEYLGPACARIARIPSLRTEPLLRAIVVQSPHEEVRAQAVLCLAQLLEQQIEVVDQLRANPELAARVIQYYGGGDYGRFLSTADRATIEKELEKVYEKMLKTFAEHTVGRTNLAELAEKSLFRIRNLSVGRVAPEIRGEDIFGQEFKLSDYRGQVVVLSFWGHW